MLGALGDASGVGVGLGVVAGVGVVLLFELALGLAFELVLGLPFGEGEAEVVALGSGVTVGCKRVRR